MYEIGRIYKIQSGNSNEVYVGSTIDTLRRRLMGHINGYNNYKSKGTSNCTLYALFDKYGVDNCRIELIKEYEIADRTHLYAYESLWISKIATINKINPLNQWSKYRKKYIGEYGDKYECKLCETQFTYKSHYDKHATICGVEKEKKKFECSKCPKVYTTKQSRDKHEDKCGQPKQDKNGQPKQYKRYNCKECNKEFRDKTDYNRHNNRHHK